MKKTWSIIVVAVLTTGVLIGCRGKAAETTTAASEVATTTTAGAETTTVVESEADLVLIVVGASPAPHAEILEAAREILAEQGYDLQIKEYTDYVQSSPASDTRDLDANYFQHYPYLGQFNQERGTKISSAAAIHYELSDIYAGKTASLDAPADGAKIAVPNDATNEARALPLLEAQGLIKLREGAGLNATRNDVAENVKKLDTSEIEAAQIPRSLQDVGIAVIDSNYATEAGLEASDALVIEDATSIAAITYGNIVAIQEGHEKDDAILALMDVLTSDTVKKFIEDRYAGAVVPLF